MVDVKEYWLRWLCGWANLFDGLCLIFTFGIWCKDLSFYAEKNYLDYVEFREYNNSQKGK